MDEDDNLKEITKTYTPRKKRRRSSLRRSKESSEEDASEFSEPSQSEEEDESDEDDDEEEEAGDIETAPQQQPQLSAQLQQSLQERVLQLMQFATMLPSYGMPMYAGNSNLFDAEAFAAQAIAAMQQPERPPEWKPVYPSRTPLANELLDVIIDNEIERQLEQHVYSAANVLCTEHTLELHYKKSSNNSKVIAAPSKRTRNKSKQVVDPEETEVSEEEQQDLENLDPLRRVIMQDWHKVLKSVQWRWDFLRLRVAQLESELEETDEMLEQIRLAKQHESIAPSTKNKKQPVYKLRNLNHKSYPPERRREDVNNHPLFAPEKKRRKKRILFPPEITAASIEEAIFAATQPPAPKKKGRRPRNLSVSIPTVKPDALFARPRQPFATPSSTTTASTPRSAANRKRAKAAAAAASKRKDYDINDIVVPWNEIRSNATVDVLRPKEIYTPQWRDAAGMHAYVEESSDEDVSDQFFCKLHMPLEIDERKRAELYFEKLANARKKKKKDTPQGKDVSMHAKAKSNSILDTTILPSPLTPFTPSLSTPTTTTITTPQQPSPIAQKKDGSKIYRYMQVTADSYVAAPFAEPTSTQGNYEEMIERCYEWEKAREEAAQAALLRQSQHTSKPAYKSQMEVFEDDYVPTDNVTLSDEDDDGWQRFDFRAHDYAHDSSFVQHYQDELSDDDEFRSRRKRKRSDRNRSSSEQPRKRARVEEHPFVYHFLRRESDTSLVYSIVPKVKQ